MKNARPPCGKTDALDQRHSNATASLFPELEPLVAPARWPADGSRAAAALQALLRGPVNQADFGPGWRLAAYVQSLEYDGWGIRSRMFAHPRCPRAIAEYTLDRQHPATAAALAARARHA
jgi:hypothetical protein